MDHPRIVCRGRFKLIKKIGAGGEADLFLAEDTKEHDKVAVKVENGLVKEPLLAREYALYKIFQGGPGVANIRYFDKEKEFQVMVMELLDQAIETCFKTVGKKFSIKTVCMIALQNFETIEFIHNKGYIHRDLKPENIMTGLGGKKGQLYIIDFGFAVPYVNSKGVHKPFQKISRMRGTARYASINMHLGNETSRRDDMETLGYTFCYYARGNLPWQGVKAANLKDRNEKLSILKQQTTLNELCQGLPQEFLTYMKYVRGLEFEETPDYNYCADLFSSLMHTSGYHNDGKFDWFTSKN